MERKEFIDQVFTFFKNNDEELKKSYDLAFSVKEHIDWDKLYRIVLKEAETRYLPTPKWFIDKFYRCNKVNNYNFANNQDMKVLVTLKRDEKTYTYEFETYNCTLSQQQIIDGFNKKYPEKVIDIKFIKSDK